MVDDFFQHVQRYIDVHGLLENVSTLIIGCSGGPDSTALLCLLDNLAKQRNIRLIVAHINYKLRGKESDRDEEFVKDLALRFGLTISVKIAPLEETSHSKGSVQMRCRTIRFDFFEELMNQTGAERVALGHTLDDNIETFFIRLFSGAGLEGLKCMKPLTKGTYIRPLLTVRSKDIESFLQAQSIPYIIDSSNVQDKYIRNRIRHILLPFIRKNFEPSIDRILSHTLTILHDENEHIDHEVTTMFNDPRVTRQKPGQIAFNRQQVINFDKAIQRRLCIKACHLLNYSGKGFSRLFEKIEWLIQQLDNPSGIPKTTLNSNLAVYGTDEWIEFTTNTSRSFSRLTTVNLTVPGQVFLEETGKRITATLLDCPLAREREDLFSDPNRELFDAQYLPDELVVRSRKPGDVFRPYGLNGTITVKKSFINSKIPQIFRNTIPLVIADDRIIWIAGYRRSDIAPVTDATKSCLLLSMTEDINSAE